MVIRFTCPNGHNLTCPDQSAGRGGKCPECGAAVRIPRQDGSPAPSNPNGGEGTAAPKEEMIVFLCPNGHRLHGPASLEGRPGQCPHCGAKFRVPSRDDPADDDEEGSQILVGESPGSGELAVGTPPSGGGDEADEPFFNFNFTEPVSGKGSSASNIKLDSKSGGSDQHPLAQLFARLWEEKSRGAFVELHLTEGVIIVPERYSKELSRRTHGVFAVKDPDGTHTLTAVAWDSISRVSVRRVNKLPKKMFD